MSEPNCVKVAFATANGRQVNAGFEKATEIVICEVGTHRMREIEVIAYDEPATYEVETTPNGRGKHKKETVADVERIAARVCSMKGVAALFVHEALNAHSALQLNREHVFTIRVDAPEYIDNLIARVQEMLLVKPPLWLRRAMEPGFAEQY